MEWTAEVYRAAGKLMAEAGTLAGVADEGGWWPAFSTNEQALDTLVRAIERAGFRPGEQVGIALDIAASEFGHGGRYKLALEDRELDSAGMIALLSGWIARYPILSIEDPLAEDDPEGFAEFTRLHGKSLQIVGDDFLVSDAARVRDAAGKGARQHGAAEAQSARHVDRDAGCLERGEGGWVFGDRIGSLGGDRGYDDRASRGRLGSGATEGRQFLARRTDGEVERNAAGRGSVGRAGPVRRRRGTGAFAVVKVVYHASAGPDLAARLAALPDLDDRDLSRRTTTRGSRRCCRTARCCGTC